MASNMKKICKECKIEMDMDCFNINNLYPDSRETRCRDCHRARKRAYYHNNKDKINLRKEKYYSINPDWKSKQARRYYQKHRIDINQKCKEYEILHKDERRIINRKYYELNSDARKLAVLHRKLKKIGAIWPPDWKCTKEWWDKLVEKYEGRCAYCFIDCKLTKFGRPVQEHVIPLKRGGLHTAHNIVPSCYPCNASKGAKLPHEFGVIPLFLDD